MEELMLGDPLLVPTEELIGNLVGQKMQLWHDIHNYLGEDYPDASGAWNFYKDGHQWLYKMVRKKNTIFWGAILKDSFRITFYFGDKAEPLIEECSLPPDIISGFRTAKRFGSIRPISIKVMNNADVENVKKLVALKVSLK